MCRAIVLFHSEWTVPHQEMVILYWVRHWAMGEHLYGAIVESSGVRHYLGCCGSFNELYIQVWLRDNRADGCRSN